MPSEAFQLKYRTYMWKAAHTDGGLNVMCVVKATFHRRKFHPAIERGLKERMRTWINLFFSDWTSSNSPALNYHVLLFSILQWCAIDRKNCLSIRSVHLPPIYIRCQQNVFLPKQKSKARMNKKLILIVPFSLDLPMSKRLLYIWEIFFFSLSRILFISKCKTRQARNIYRRTLAKRLLNLFCGRVEHSSKIYLRKGLILLFCIVNFNFFCINFITK